MIYITKVIFKDEANEYVMYSCTNALLNYSDRHHIQQEFRRDETKMKLNLDSMKMELIALKKYDHEISQEDFLNFIKNIENN